MRVYDQSLNGAAASQAGGAQEIQRTDRAGGSRANAAGATGDRVELSSTLGTVSRVLEAHRSDRAARVAELSAQYSRGEYQPDPAATSRAMLSEALA